MDTEGGGPGRRVWMIFGFGSDFFSRLLVLPVLELHIDRIIQYTHTKKKKGRKKKESFFDFLWPELRRTFYEECKTVK